MIELTRDQAQTLSQAKNPTVIDPTTRKTYALVPTDAQEYPLETPVEPWKHLVARRHPWRKQLFIRGRNMTVRVLVGTLKANGFTEEEAAQDLHLPVEAIREALAYFEANPEVIALDAAYEQYQRKLHGVGRGPESVPR